MGGEGRFEGRGAVQGQLLIVTVMHRLRRHKADATVAMLSVVPVEERLAVDSSVFDGFEALWEVGPIFTFYLTGDLSSAQTSCEASETGCRARVCLSMVYNRIGRHDDAAANLELITTQGV